MKHSHVTSDAARARTKGEKCAVGAPPQIHQSICTAPHTDTLRACVYTYSTSSTTTLNLWGTQVGRVADGRHSVAKAQGCVRRSDARVRRTRRGWVGDRSQKPTTAPAVARRAPTGAVWCGKGKHGLAVARRAPSRQRAEKDETAGAARPADAAAPDVQHRKRRGASAGDRPGEGATRP